MDSAGTSAIVNIARPFYRKGANGNRQSDTGAISNHADIGTIHINSPSKTDTTITKEIYGSVFLKIIEVFNLTIEYCFECILVFSITPYRFASPNPIYF